MMILTQDCKSSRALQEFAIFQKWELILVRSCDEAIAVLSWHRVPLVICDDDLAGNNWRDALQRIARLPQSICLPLAFHAADPELRKEVARCHGYGLIRKPCRTDELTECVSLAFGWRRKSLGRCYERSTSAGGGAPP